MSDIAHLVGLTHFAGLRVVFTPTALEETKERRFPESRHRSARIRKKLIRRYGSEFRMVPAMWRYGDTVFAHPNFAAKFRALAEGETLPDESGASLRATGWKLIGERGGGDWGRTDRPRTTKHPTQPKLRWEATP